MLYDNAGKYEFSVKQESDSVWPIFIKVSYGMSWLKEQIKKLGINKLKDAK